MLDHDDILKLRKAVIAARLTNSRIALLAGIEAQLVDTLTTATSPSDQILQDLTTLNKVGVLADQSIPLVTWLKNAVELAAVRKEACVFKDALERCRSLHHAHCAHADLEVQSTRPSPPYQRVVRTPVATREILYSNLVPLQAFPQTIYIAPANFKTRKQAWAMLRDGTKRHVINAWLPHEKNLLSLIDPQSTPLSTICDTTRIEEHEVEHWSEADDSVLRRQFVQLLNGALRDDLGMRGVFYWFEDNLYAFAGTLDKPERRYEYASIDRSQSTITVVHHYVSKSKDGRRFPFLRHNAFRGHFRRIDGQWYLEIIPTYRFTTDGRLKYRFHEDHLAGIKRIEKNRSVLSQVLLWNDVLRIQPSLLDARRPLLTFGAIRQFEVDRGIAEEDWVDTSPEDDSSAIQLALNLPVRTAS